MCCEERNADCPPCWQQDKDQKASSDKDQAPSPKDQAPGPTPSPSKVGGETALKSSPSPGKKEEEEFIFSDTLDGSTALECAKMATAVTAVVAILSLQW